MVDVCRLLQTPLPIQNNSEYSRCPYIRPRSRHPTRSQCTCLQIRLWGRHTSSGKHSPLPAAFFPYRRANRRASDSLPMRQQRQQRPPSMFLLCAWTVAMFLSRIGSGCAFLSPRTLTTGDVGDHPTTRQARQYPELVWWTRKPQCADGTALEALRRRAPSR